MSGGLHSSNWFRIAALRPRLAGHARIHRHRYRGAVWYVVEDRLAGRYHRFNPQAYRVVAALDGRRTMQQIWDALAADLHEDSPSQEDIVQLLGQLNAADLVVSEASVDVAELFARHTRQDRQKRLGRWSNPLSLKLPLVDPDRFLAALAQATAGIPGWAIAALWLLAVLPAALVVPQHWHALTENFGDRVLAEGNLAILAIAFVLLKGLHELGHGIAARRRGGEVHEMGLMLLMLYPVPYVDASSASAFPRRRDRIAVGAAGMAVELFVAALAFQVWRQAEPGFVRALAYNLMVVGGVTTVLFNANPLLRYDGYYIFADLIGIPNLGQRANAWWNHLMRRHAFGIASDQPPLATAAERRWFTAYAPAAFAYRLSVTLSIAWFIGTQYFFVGVLLAAWSIATGLAWPIARGLVRLRADPQVGTRRARVWGLIAGVPALALLLLFTVPLPHHTRAVGVVALPDDAVVRAGTDGFVQALAARSGTVVAPGTLIAVSTAPELAAERRQQAAKLEEAQAERDAAWGVKPAAAGRLEQQVAREATALARLDAEAAALEVRARAAGTLLVEQPDDLPGRYLKKGEPIGMLLGAARPVVKVVVTQQDADRVRAATVGVQVRLAQDFARPLDARLAREVPQAGRELPAAALGALGGGTLATDPRDEKGLTALEAVFTFEVALPEGAAPPHLGSRAWVAFAHADEPLGFRLWRSARRQFLSHFHV